MIPDDAEERKSAPVLRGFLDYFPDAVFAVAHLSWKSTQQHHPDKPMHWDKSKSADEGDCAIRHLMQRGTRDTDGERHSAKAAWRAMANLQREIEESGFGRELTPEEREKVYAGDPTGKPNFEALKPSTSPSWRWV